VASNKTQQKPRQRAGTG